MFIPGLRTWQSVALSVPIRLTQAASMVLMADSNVFVTGGPLECDTYSINRFSGEVKVLDSMGVHRQKMGAIRYQADIYTFAGIKSFTYPKSAEVYLCSLKQWKRLPDCLVSRCNFNPAQYQGCVYLLGGSCTQTSECYNVSAETFYLLPLVFPVEDCTIGVCDSGELIAIQKEIYYACAIGRWEEGWKRREFTFNLGIALWSDCPVFKVAGAYYIHQNYATRIVALNLSEGTFSAFPAPIY